MDFGFSTYNIGLKVLTHCSERNFQKFPKAEEWGFALIIQTKFFQRLLLQIFCKSKLVLHMQNASMKMSKI